MGFTPARAKPGPGDRPARASPNISEFWQRLATAAASPNRNPPAARPADVAGRQGWAMGGGTWYRLCPPASTMASDRAVFAQAGGAATYLQLRSFLFAALCGWKSANRWALTGDHFDAQEALRIGMINEGGAARRADGAGLPCPGAASWRWCPEPALRLNKAITVQGIQAAGLHAGLLVEEGVRQARSRTHIARRVSRGVARCSSARSKA